MNRIDRLVGMILLLQGKRVITAEEMAAHFEISVRTVYRDLVALGEAGVPIAAEAGVGYSLMRGYHVPPVMFTEDEAAALFISGEISERLADASLRGALKAALLKINSILPAARRDSLQRLRGAISVWPMMSPVPPGLDGRTPDDRATFMPLQDAVVRRRCVALSYNAASRGEISQRTVEPLGLVFYSRQWHLIAFCRMRRAFRDFRLDRVAEWHVLEETYTGHEDFSLTAFLRESIEQHDLTPAALLVRRPALDRLCAGLPSTPVKTELLPPHPDYPEGRVRLEILIFSIRYTTHWLLGFGTEVQALEPPELLESLRNAALAVASSYAPAPVPSDKIVSAKRLLT